jgi:hypothetical protein
VFSVRHLLRKRKLRTVFKRLSLETLRAAGNPKVAECRKEEKNEIVQEVIVPTSRKVRHIASL